MVANVLGRLIDRAKEVGLIEGFVVGRDRVEISHLQFADGTLFFSSGDESKFLNFQVILQTFELVSGLKVNLGKCAIVGINCEGVKV